VHGIELARAEAETGAGDRVEGVEDRKVDFGREIGEVRVI